MAKHIVFFDTNILPYATGFDQASWTVLFRLREMLAFEVVIPEMVLLESARLRQEKADLAFSKLQESYDEAAKFYMSPGLYIPSADGVGLEWETDLRSRFTVVPGSPHDALEALDREVHRRRPARKGVGARDAIIWLTVRNAVAAGSDVLFVSNNTRDFANDDGDLHPDLADELSSLAGSLSYFRGLEQLLDHVATKAEPPDGVAEAITELLDWELRLAFARELIEAGRDSDLFAPLQAHESFDVAPGLDVTVSLIKHCYSVTDITVLLAYASAELSISLRNFRLDFKCWVIADEGGAIGSAELDASKINFSELPDLSTSHQ